MSKTTKSKSELKAQSATIEALNLDDEGLTFRQFLHDFFFVSKHFEHGRSEFARFMGVTAAQYNILMAVAREGSQGVSQIADKLHLHQPFVTMHLGKLSDQGLIRRRPNSDDRRSTLLEITPAGWSAIRKTLPLVQHSNDAMFGILDEREVRQLAKIFEKLARNCDAATSTLEAERIRLEKK